MGADGVTGCVAVTEDGTRLGTGGGFGDREFAVASEAGLIDPATLVATTVHAVQLLPAGAIPSTAHDVAVDLVVTPDRILEVGRSAPRTAGRLVGDELTDDKVAAIPLLARMPREHRSGDR